MTVLAPEQLHYSWVEIHTISGALSSNHSGRSNSCSIRQNFKIEFTIFIWSGCKIVCWTVCSFASLYLKVIKSRKVKRTFMLLGKTIQLPSVSHACAECMREKKKEGKGGKSSHFQRLCHCVYRWDGKVKCAQATINHLAEIIFWSKPLWFLVVIFFDAKSSWVLHCYL